MRPPIRSSVLSFVCLSSALCSDSGPQIQVTVARGVTNRPLAGRLIVVFTKNGDKEPRLQFTYGLQAPQVFGIDVNGMRAGQVIVLDDQTPGHPIRNLSGLSAGRYHVQAVLNVYETVHRSDGHVLKLPMGAAQGLRWTRTPGNLLSDPQQVAIDHNSRIRIELSRVIEPLPAPQDTKYIRYVRRQSALLTRFWGRPMYIGAVVLLPPGFDENPKQRYPIIYRPDHFLRNQPFIQETSPSEGLTGHERRLAEAKHKFFKGWSEARMPKVIFALIQDPTPYYDSSYGVNSANAGPYGDALMKEFYPFLEEKFRAIGAPWARIIYGGSTGGWASLAQLLAYPDYFGGAWSCCPGALDFRAFQTIDIYNDTNAFYDIGPFNRIPKPLGRLESGKLLVTVEDYSRQQLVTGTKSRSGGEMDAYDATYGPVGPDGYPTPLWNPETGTINPRVARHWRENYDLGFILRRDWKQIGSKLVGKIHVIVGSDDTYYLENGVRFVEEVLQSTTKPENGPFYAGTVTYGPDAPHCYSGVPNGVTIEQHFLPIFVAHMLKLAPSGADLEPWMPSTSKRHPLQ